MTIARAQPRVKLLCACLFTALGISAGSAHAVPPVLAVSDCTDDDTVGTLRNQLSQVDSNGFTIDTSFCSSITLSQGELATPFSVVINGVANAPTTIDAGSHTWRVFHSIGATSADTSLTLNHLIVRGGRDIPPGGSGHGGCILSGAVTLQDTLVTDCVAVSIIDAASGGAINAASLTLHASRVENSSVYSGQDTAADGGGVYVSGALNCYYSSISGNKTVPAGVPPQINRGGGAFSKGDVLLEQCTIDSNTSGNGGGLIQADGSKTFQIRNSTVSGNYAGTGTGGVLSDAPLTIDNSTVTNNSSANCGGVRGNAAITMNSSIVAGNFSTNPSSCTDIATSAGITGGNNLVSVVTVTTPVPEGTIIADPRLTPLANHGGLTSTHALSPTSPAVNAGSNGGMLDFDQRGDGFIREVGAPDIGAYERQSDDDQLFFNGFQ